MDRTYQDIAYDETPPPDFSWIYNTDLSPCHAEWPNLDASRSSNNSSRASTVADSSQKFPGGTFSSYKDVYDYRKNSASRLGKYPVSCMPPSVRRQNVYSNQMPTNLLNNLYAENAQAFVAPGYPDAMKIDQKANEDCLATDQTYVQGPEAQHGMAPFYMAPLMTPILVSPDNYPVATNGIPSYENDAGTRGSIDHYEQDLENAEYLSAPSPEYAKGFGRQRRGSQVAKGSPTKRCPTCHKRLRRDLTRHMRIHEAVADFACPFPREQCAHKHGQFNRPYEFKKHLMNCHFSFDNPYAVKHAKNLSERLELGGTCQCGFKAETVTGWIANHLKEGKCSMTPNVPRNLQKSGSLSA